MTARAYQLFDEQGQSIPDGAATWKDIFSNGLLHAAAHVWIWRRKKKGGIELLLQRRAKDMRTFPDKLDISAAGHVDANEDPLATALRETGEELGLQLEETDLKLAFVHRMRLQLEPEILENEWRWVYLLEFNSEQPFQLDADELAGVQWIDLGAFKKEIANEATYDKYVPQGGPYFAMLFEALEAVTSLAAEDTQDSSS